MKRKYKATVVDRKTLRTSTVEGEVDVPANYPSHAASNIVRSRIDRTGKTAATVEIDGQEQSWRS